MKTQNTTNKTNKKLPPSELHKVETYIVRVPGKDDAEFGSFKNAQSLWKSYREDGIEADVYVRISYKTLDKP